MEDLGFNTGQPVIVTVEYGQLLIRIAWLNDRQKSWPF
ncbi:SymE family type I addiction module toxin [Pectobacterium versatile]|nr:MULTISPECIES: type I addiction module toxin, SymE family [Pectobacterium]MCA5933637.1 type I addiction module toxin, SymE family [Pectobacterium versatile]MCA5950826.1 type I addiction module toxin, SymE family [Pectobacterium versatile]MCA5955168.1 type I addiction module toxin, SymE family [Pectobacterium versatile]MCA6917994.1 type I addiction module toxin, SymE family [Pectobacterium versatile]MCA6937552.1 type I addiction module toxin, SymE family [Pectobacterium versatile]